MPKSDRRYTLKYKDALLMNRKFFNKKKKRLVDCKKLHNLKVSLNEDDSSG